MSEVNQLEAFGVAKSEAATRKLRDIIRENLGDVTSEEYEAYLTLEEKLTQELIDHYPSPLSGPRAVFEHFVKVARSYHINCTALLLLGTYKKLRPDATPEEMDTLYFITWMCEWIGSVMFVIDDISEGDGQRATQRTLFHQLGTAKAISYFVLTENLLYDMAEKRFAKFPHGGALLGKFREYTKTIMIAEQVDSFTVEYDKFLDVKWHHIRKYTGSVVPMALFPTDLAIFLANQEIDAEVVKYTADLSWLFGSYMRDLDDMSDLEEDTRNGSLNWGHLTAWNKAKPEQRKILMKVKSYPLDDDTLQSMMKVYEDLDINEDLRLYQQRETANFENLLKECPEQIAVKTWRACWEYTSKLFVKASECV